MKGALSLVGEPAGDTHKTDADKGRVPHDEYAIALMSVVYNYTDTFYELL